MASTTRTARRAAETQQRRNDRVRRSTHPATRRSSRVMESSAPPVMARGSQASRGTSPARGGKRGGKARRRYDVALNVPGAEIRLPSMPQVRVGWRVISAALVALLSFLLYQLWNSPTYRVQAVEVSGLQRLTDRDVDAVLDVHGEPIFSINPGKVKQEIQSAFPEFTAVSVQVGLPNTVAITVTERVPVLTWYQDGRTELVDAEGMAFPLREGGQAGPSPLVEALSPPPVLDPALLEPQALDLEATQAETQGAAQPSPIKPVTAGPRQLLTPEMVAGILAMAEKAPEGIPLVYDSMHGLGWRDAGGWEIYLGDVQDIQMKLSVYQAIAGRLQAEGIQPALISVEYVHAPYYRLER